MNGPQLTAICTEIAALTITYNAGTLVIKNLTSIPETLDRSAAAAVMVPRPDEFITGFEWERTGLGPSAQTSGIYRYTLTYHVATSAAGTGRGLADVYPANIGWAAAIVSYFSSHEIELTNCEIISARIGRIGVVTDAAGSSYNGFEVLLDIEEYV